MSLLISIFIIYEFKFLEDIYKLSFWYCYYYCYFWRKKPQILGPRAIQGFCTIGLATVRLFKFYLKKGLQIRAGFSSLLICGFFFDWIYNWAVYHNDVNDTKAIGGQKRLLKNVEQMRKRFLDQDMRGHLKFMRRHWCP